VTPTTLAGIRTGAIALSTGYANLDEYRPAYLGHDVDSLLQRMESCCGPLLEDPPRPVDESRIPKIALTEV
jgi:hypothetical protein